MLAQGRRRAAPDRLVGLVRVPELLLRFVPGAPEVRRPVVHPATALRDPCTHHCTTHLVPAHAAASMHHSGSVGLASLLTSHVDSAHGKRDRQFLACSHRRLPCAAHAAFSPRAGCESHDSRLAACAGSKLNMAADHPERTAASPRAAGAPPPCDAFGCAACCSQRSPMPARRRAARDSLDAK